jgi:hypothetical protein
MVVVLRASRDLREAGGESSSTPRPCEWLPVGVDEVGVWELEASISRSFSLSLLLSLMEEKKFLKSFALGLSLGSTVAGSSTLFSPCFEPGGGFVPIGARCGRLSASRASESSSSMMSSGGPEAPCCTEGLLDGCREPNILDCWPGAFQPPRESGLARAPPMESLEGHASAPQRLLSKLGRGNSDECVDPGRGEAGRRPAMKFDGHPSGPLSLLKGFRLKARLLGCEVGS